MSKKEVKPLKKKGWYYPFGLTHKYGASSPLSVITAVHPYGFGGKEYNEELSLDWYDVSARNYDPALGRWMNLDPLAEQMRRHSPYNYAFDNPVFWTDYDGMMPSQGDPIKKLKAAAKKVDNALVQGGLKLFTKIGKIFSVGGGTDFYRKGGKGGKQPPKPDTVDKGNIDMNNGEEIVNVLKNTKPSGPKTANKIGESFLKGKKTASKSGEGVVVTLLKKGEEMETASENSTQFNPEPTMNAETTANEVSQDTTFNVETAAGKTKEYNYSYSRTKNISVTVQNTTEKVDSTNTHHSDLIKEQNK